MDGDRELLERAARAAGVPAYWSDDGTLQQRPIFVTKAGGGMATMPYEAEWNPLKDDAAALRLAVKARITVQQSATASGLLPSVECYAAEDSDSEVVEEVLGDDPAAATRRAIVRATAAMAPAKESEHG